MMSWFTDINSQSVVRYFWLKDEIPMAAILILMENGIPSRGHFTVHQSFCWSSDLAKLPNVEKTYQQYKILNSIIAALTKEYKILYLSFHPNIVDMRPLIEHNQNKTQNGTFKINVRYTATSTLTDINSIEDVLLKARNDRRSDYKKYIKAKIAISSKIEKSEFIDLYRKTFSRQGIGVDVETESILKQIVYAVSSPASEEKGFILGARSENNSPISTTVILTSRNCAYSLITANDPEFRGTGANTAIVFEAMLHAKRLGKKEFDFVGVNSPNRGDFKLSFNASLRRYFEAELVYP